MDAHRTGSRLLTGFLAGGAAWVLGLICTVVVGQLLGGGTGAGEPTVDAGPLSVVGLLFLAAHFVEAEPHPPVAEPFNFVSDLAGSVDPGYTLLFAVPPLVLVVAGGVVAVRDDNPLAGGLPVLGYLPLCAAGAALFRLEIETGLVPIVFRAPLPTAVVVAGAAYPLVLGLAGGLVARGVVRHG